MLSNSLPISSVSLHGYTPPSKTANAHLINLIKLLSLNLLDSL